jgi:monovalent cation/proton antiporter MnhG/PhaG subunit
VSAQTWAVDVLLAAGVVAQLVCCLGVLLARTAFDRLHYAGAGSTVGPILIMVAILILHGSASEDLQTIAAVLVLVIASPVAVHALARAARQAYFGQTGRLPEELEQQGSG